MWVLTEKELRTRYKMAVLGFLWIILNPLIQMLVMGFVFQYFIPIKQVNYFEFLFPGLLAWNFFSITIGRNTPIYVNERRLIQKARFPRESMVLSVILANLFHFFVALLVFVVWEALVVHEIHYFRWWLLFPIVIWLTVLTFGISLLFSSLNVRWRDVNFAVQTILPLWFYATPVVYPLEIIPGWLARIIYLNPVTPVIEMIRWATLGLPLNWVAVGWSALITVAILLVGIYVFRKESPFFDDWV